jgi:hypothetical protein
MTDRCDPISGDMIAYGLRKRVWALEKFLEQINSLACYASEEDIDSREQVLLEIGKLARSALPQEGKP